MTDTSSGLAERAAGLRSAFDRAFATPVRADTTIKQDLLAIRVGPEPCAIRLSEVAGLFVDRRIMRIPASDGVLIGIAGFRGAIVPVYSLRSLLGHSGTQALRWLVIAANAPIALAFDVFEGHLRVSTDAILPQQAHAQMRGYAAEFVRSAGVVRPVLHLASVIAALGTSTPSAAA
jgi:purine-binding chemotaxis protein CheW